jgi:hypothetical protein
MIENLVLYPIIGFVATYLALEVAWHLTACKVKDKAIKPSLFRQVGLVK